MIPRPLRRPAGRRATVARPAAHVAEPLEPRALLTTFVVDSTADVVADDGETTLREALLAAETNAPAGDAEAGEADGDRITFDLAAGSGTTIFLADALPDLSDDLVIDGGDGNSVTLLAAVGETIFESVSTEAFTFSNLTLTFGTADRGGAMMIEGGADVTFEEMTFGANVSEGDGGGAVYVTGESTLDITGGAFQGNSAAGDDGDGGAILIEGGTLSISGTDFTGNAAAGGDSDEGGGAIFAESDADVSIVRADFDGNTATGDAGSGGAIHARGGSLDVTGTTFNDNAAVRAGGAIETADGTAATLADSRFTRNVAGADEDGEEGAEDGNPGNGGALHVSGSDAATDVTNTYFALNRAANQGGALWNADDSEMAVDGSVFSTNTASGGDSGDGGGAIYDQGDGALTVTGSQFFRNSADGESGSGGGLLTAGGNARVTGSVFNMNDAPRAGGAVEIGTGFVTITDTRFTRNRAGLGDRATGEEAGESRGNPGNGGAVHVTGDAVTRVDGGVVARNEAANEGGGLWNSSGGDMTVSDVSVARNFAFGDDPDSGGGGFYNDGGTLRIRNAFVSVNAALGESGSGGGLLSTGGAVLVNDSNFNMNSAARAGGGIELVDGDLRFTDSFLRNNFAGSGGTANPGNGAGYHATGQALAIFSGGGVFRNVADNEGGGLWNQDDARLVLTDGVRVRDNIAAVGGGVYNNGGRFDLRDGSRLFNNEARGGDGGGLFNAGDGNAYLDDSRVTGNSADGTGGGVFAESGARTFLRDAVFADNDPNDVDGPGLYLGDPGSVGRDGMGGEEEEGDGPGGRPTA